MRKKKRKAPKVASRPIVEAVPSPSSVPKRPTIQELEAILNAEGDTSIEILPSGEVRKLSQEEIEKRPKPLTMREHLGGEYGEVA